MFLRPVYAKHGPFVLTTRRAPPPSPAGKKHLESAVLHCLCLLDLTLQKEVMFMDLLRESQASMLVSPLEQLLQGVNPQTRRADHIVNIARY